MKAADSVVIDEIAQDVDVANALAVRIAESSSGPTATVLKQAARTPSLDKHLVGFAKRAIQPAVRALAYRMLFDEKAKWPVGWGWKWIDKSMGERVRVPVFEHRTIMVEYDFTEMLKTAAADKSASVRRVAGTALVSRMDDLSSDQLAIARDLSKDSYPSIAERGNYVLTKLGDQS